METLIYIALFSVITSYVLGVFYQLLGSRNQNRDRTEVDAEANFLMQKLRWAMSGVQTVNQPATGATSTTLSVTKYNFAQNPIVFDLDSSTLRMAKGGGAAVILNNSRVGVGQLTFERLAPVSNAPEGVTITLSVSSLDVERPVVASTTIVDTIYLR
ncbi:MAG: hypothetical protein HY434_01595 [Candidatus Liptonbacteria bacterium]|nr:hypothetical protein [Candidatus Liptonbacteria bacterium]